MTRAKPNPKPERDESIKLPLDPEEAIDALLRVDPESQPVSRGLPGIDDEPDLQYQPADAKGSADDVGALIDERRALCAAEGTHELSGFDDPREGPVILCTRCCGGWRTT